MKRPISLMTWPKVKETAPVALSTVIPITECRGEILITVSKGQPWDAVLEGMFKADAIVLVLDGQEKPLYAFRRLCGDVARMAN